MAVQYRELVVKGKSSALRGFLWGFKLAKQIKKGLIFCADYPINTHHIKEILSGHADHVHLITSAQHHKSLVEAIAGAEPLGFELVSDNAVTQTYFEFKFETFSRDVAEDLKRTLKGLPAGLRLVDYEPEEVEDPSAKGVEFYSPVHDYRFSGKGRIEGTMEMLLHFHHILREHVFIEVKDIQVEH